MNEAMAEQLIARWQQGDQQAAADLYQSFAQRLIALVRSRLPATLAARLDAEDVVQSAYRSFFAHVRAGRYDPQRGGDLWNFLVAIALHKLHKQVRRNQAQKRAAKREQTLQVGTLSEESTCSSEPSPVEALALLDAVQEAMKGLGAEERRMLELRLQGSTYQEIATETGRSVITVRRFLQRIKQRFERGFD